MVDTIERSLTSLLNQLDQRFEVVVVDDGSTDQSIEVVKSLQQKHSNLRLVALKRDKNRKLGMTRNISVREAMGDYVMLHLDCDDVFGPFISEFVEVFKRIERCIGRNIVLSGKHINMGKRDFLLSHGPYINIYRGEDRNLWSRMANLGVWIPLDHVDFIERLPKRLNKKLLKNIKDTFDHMKNDFRFGVKLSRYYSYEIKKRKDYSLKLLVFRLLMLIPSWLFSKFQPPIPKDGTIGCVEKFAAYRESVRGTYSEIMARNGGDPDLSFLARPEAIKIFASRGDA